MMLSIRGWRVFLIVASVALASLTVVVRPATAEGHPQARAGWFPGSGFGGAHASAQSGFDANDVNFGLSFDSHFIGK